jgi:RNA polymerase-binding transcription factor DksA
MMKLTEASVAAEDDPYYNRDTIAALKQKPEDGPWAGRMAKLRILKAQIEENAKGESPPLLKAIDEALDRIRAGIYHLCSKCGRRISETRDRTEGPWITSCAACRGGGAAK